MQSEEMYEQLKHFLETETACVKTLSCLNKSAQIDIIVGGAVQCCVQYLDKQVLVRKENGSSPDLIFHASPEAVETLIADKGLNPGELGVKLVKQLITGQVTFTMPGNLLSVLRKGYLDIMKVGGIDFINELRQHNLASPTKIISALKKLKKRS